MGCENVRLYVPGTMTGFQRGLTNQHSHTSLIAIEGCKTKDEAKFYLGKRIAFVYKAQTLKKGTYFRCIWGKATRTHGAIGGVRAKFTKNLPAKAMGARVRVMLYPSTI